MIKIFLFFFKIQRVRWW